MNTRNIILAKICSSVVVLLATTQTAQAEWKVDFSRRTKEVRTQDLRAPASTDAMPEVGPAAGSPPPTFFESLFQAGDVAQARFCETDRR